MKLANTTSFPEDRIREIIQFVKPNNLPTSNFDVRVNNSAYSYRGYFLPSGEYSSRKLRPGRSYVFPSRCQIVAKISNDESKFPLIENRDPSRTVSLCYDEYNEKKGVWEEYRISHPIAISKAYIARKNRENKASGKLYNWTPNVGGYIPSLILSREEALVHILAHELRHFWQVNHKTKRGKVWGAKGVYSERDTDAYAIRKTREWRRLYTPREIYREQPDSLVHSGSVAV
jgi:hypothetical protein